MHQNVKKKCLLKSKRDSGPDQDLNLLSKLLVAIAGETSTAHQYVFLELCVHYWLELNVGLISCHKWFTGGEDYY